MCATLGEAVAKTTALDRETWQPQQQQHQGGVSSRSSPYPRPTGGVLPVCVASHVVVTTCKFYGVSDHGVLHTIGETSQQRQDARRAKETGR
ncbi:hypothetical protein Taro_032548 [Colocasia esculenta]|uniref:Uncharacterized protein n=1 Tax=Colocasia esculenta TaxID=4460 RepID=A0A843VSX6_COLES|nr:hypothetical protein [Colocasia esculenta]